MPTEKKKDNATFPEEFYRDPLGLNRYVVQEKVLMNWLTPNRVKKEWQKSELMTMAIASLGASLILLFLGEYFLLFVLLITIGLVVLLTTTKPVQLQCQITTIGVKVDEKYYFWPQLSQFWFESRRGVLFLCLRDIFSQPMIVKLIIRPEDQEKIKTTIGTYLLYKKPQRTPWQKFLEPLTDKLPFDLDVW